MFLCEMRKSTSCRQANDQLQLVACGALPLAVRQPASTKHIAMTRASALWRGLLWGRCGRRREALKRRLNPIVVGVHSRVCIRPQAGRAFQGMVNVAEGCHTEDLPAFA